jgi:hypothetical protein
MRFLSLRGHRRDTTPWCLDTWVVNHDLRVLYACIPKAACTSIMTWLVRSAGFAPELLQQFERAESCGLCPGALGYPDIHSHLDTNYSLRPLSAPQIDRLLTDPSYFKFTVVRNPLTRLVSGYLDKVVKARSPARRIIRASQFRKGQLGWSAVRRWMGGQAFLDPERSLSFREFVEHLLRERPDQIDIHFRPQSRLLRGITLDFTGHLERIEQDFAVIQRRLGISARLPKDNVQPIDQADGSDCVADWPAARFRGGAIPNYSQFLDGPLLAAARTLFAADFDRWNYHCDTREASRLRAA